MGLLDFFTGGSDAPTKTTKASSPAAPPERAPYRGFSGVMRDATDGGGFGQSIFGPPQKIVRRETPQEDYSFFRDIFDGGGMGHSANAFGGRFGGLLNAFGVRPMGYTEPQKPTADMLAAKNAMMRRIGTAPPAPNAVSMPGRFDRPENPSRMPPAPFANAAPFNQRRVDYLQSGDPDLRAAYMAYLKMFDPSRRTGPQ